MKLNKIYLPFIYLILALLSSACDDMHDQNPSTSGGITGEENTAEIYVLSEGLFNQNNSTLARHTFNDNRTVTNYFQALNRRGLGDTANDLQLYDDKLFIVVNVSSQIEVIDFKTGLTVKQIPMLQENGSSRQPRNIAFHNDKAFVCCFDGSVVRIDIPTLEIDAIAQAGRNPDGICIQNGKIYVSNSGGLDLETIGPDETVSVFDAESFNKIKDINVGLNPGKIAAGMDETVLVVVRGKDLESGNARLVEIDANSDVVSRTFNEYVLNFAVNDELVYFYNHQYTTGKTSYKVLNQRSGLIINPDFIMDDSRISTPYGIFVNPYNGNIYITDAYTYNVKGDVYCFSPQGEFNYSIDNIGINPNSIVFSEKSSQSQIDPTPDDTNATNAFANKVLEYNPAPGQFMNTTTMAYKDGYNEADILNYATERINNKYLISLGGFGGSITLGFHKSIPNKEDEYDFKVYGNASYNMYGTATGALGGSAEPGIVWVSKDTNENGLPDDEWFELAGSEYGTSNETRGYEITYYRPSPLDADVKWKDNQGNEGYVLRNSYNTQSSYYPLWIGQEELTFSGTRLKDNAVNENGMWIGYCYAWGYADNHPNSTEMTKFKIDWAVDADGNKANLDKIDFVRITTAVNQDAGNMGEISTEVMTVENLHYNN